MALRLGMCKALTVEVLTKLHTAGIVSAAEFVSRDLESLSKELHIPYKDLCSIQRVSLAENSAYPVSALALYQNALSSLAILSTGSDVLDQLLDGGLYTGEVTELAGDTVSGKTRICHWCAASTVKEGCNSVLYIDICKSFTVGILMDTMSEEAPDPQVIQSRLSRVKFLQVFDLFQLFSALEEVELCLSQQLSPLLFGLDSYEDMVCMMVLTEQTPSDWKSLKLVVIENLPLLIYPNMTSSAPYNQGTLSRLGIKLKQLADSLSIAILVTNHLVGFYGQDKSDQRKAALGKVWSQVPHTRVILNRRSCGLSNFPSSSEVEAKLVKSGRQQTPCSATFCLSNGGPVCQTSKT